MRYNNTPPTNKFPSATYSITASFKNSEEDYTIDFPINIQSDIQLIKQTINNAEDIFAANLGNKEILTGKRILRFTCKEFTEGVDGNIQYLVDNVVDFFNNKASLLVILEDANGRDEIAFNQNPNGTSPKTRRTPLFRPIECAPQGGYFAPTPTPNKASEFNPNIEQSAKTTTNQESSLASMLGKRARPGKQDQEYLPSEKIISNNTIFQNLVSGNRSYIEQFKSQYGPEGSGYTIQDSRYTI